jgi:hypothetical protein
MASKKRGKQRPFRRSALDAYASPDLRLRMGPGEAAWRYTLTLPLEEIKPRKRQKATLEDLDNLERMFADHFRGFSRLPNSLGYGLRDATKPEQGTEMNYNVSFVVLVAPVPQADAYFRALRKELQTALQEGVILVERHDVWIP